MKLKIDAVTRLIWGEKLRRLKPGTSHTALARQDVKPFVMFFLGRSGSTYIIETLNKHPEIRAAKEIFSYLKQKGEDGQAQLQWMQHFFQLYRQGPYQAVGFKTKIKDVLDPDGLAQALQEIGANIILLRRKNSIKHMVSVFNSVRLNEATGNWNLYRPHDRLTPVHIDVDTFKSWLPDAEAERQHLENYVRQLQLPTYDLYYEDLLLNEQKTFESISEFLGVEYKPVSGDCIKHTSDDLRQAVANFDELRSAYLGTSYEAMFDELLKP